MELKYKLTDETIVHEGHVLHRIQALKDIDRYGIRAGHLGGYVEDYHNLSQYGECWVSNNAKVYNYGVVMNNALVTDYAKVYNNAIIGGNAIIMDYAKVHNNSHIVNNVNICNYIEVNGPVCICGNCNFTGDAVIESDKDYIVFKNWWSSGRYFVWTRSNNKWSVGCFYGTGEELIAKAYKDSPISGREYERIVKYVEDILKQ